MQTIENLRDIIYEAVTEDYGWGKYGEFRVLIRKKDGYVNATKLCQDGGKSFKNWMANEKSNQIIERCQNAAGFSAAFFVCEQKTDGPFELRGTYVHQFLVPHIASWISADFAIKVSQIVNNFIVREYRESIREKTEKIDSLEREMKEFRAESARRDEEAKKERDLLQAKLDLANENLLESLIGINQANHNISGLHGKLTETCEMYVPPSHLHPKDTETYAIFYCKQTIQGRVYIQTRARPFHLRNRITELEKKYGDDFREVLRITPVANSRSLASEFERRIREHGLIFNQTHQKIIIPDDAEIGEQEMIELAQEVFGERREPDAAAANLSVVSFDLEEGRLRAQKHQKTEALLNEEEKQEEPNYDQELRELLSKRLDELKDQARAFPKDIKTYGGYSKLGKIDLARWILRRRGLEPLQ